MNAKAISTRVKEHHARRVASGLRQVRVWVPEGDVERIKKYAAQLRHSAYRKDKK